jgi:uncharacterized protein YeaO (DUF488 family)
MPHPTIHIKRIYEVPVATDGFRILVDRLWPRGLTKAAAAVDEWAKAVAPSTELRQWYGHEPEKWEVFQKRYLAELKQNEAIDAFVETHEDKKQLTLLYAAKDEAHTHAIVLQHYLEERYRKR